MEHFAIGAVGRNQWAIPQPDQQLHQIGQQGGVKKAGKGILNDNNGFMPLMIGYGVEQGLTGNASTSTTTVVQWLGAGNGRNIL